MTQWWERERLFTGKDREAIARAKELPWEEIDETTAETVAGMEEIKDIRSRKFHRAEYMAGML